MVSSRTALQLAIRNGTNMLSSETKWLVFSIICAVGVIQCGCDSTPQRKEADVAQAKSAQIETADKNGQVESAEKTGQVPDDAEDATSLFDGETLDGWDVIEFGGEGDVEVVDGAIQMMSGDPLTGICIAEGTELPKANYEVSLEGMKLEGSDFFCAITFPVNDTFCTMVVGGWGGNLVGLSNLDGRDASENGTKVTRKFAKNQWYAIRIQVLQDRITAWIDDEKLIDESIVDREVSIRNDVITTTPLGITNFITVSALRNIKIRKLD